MSSKRSQKYTYGRVIVPFTYEVYTEILDYLRLCLWFSAGATDLSDELQEAPKLNAYIRENYGPTDDNGLQRYLLLLKQILPAKRGSTELMCLYDLLNAELETLSAQCRDLLESFALALKDVAERTRVLVSRIVGILWAIGTPISEFNVHVSTFGLRFFLLLLPQILQILEIVSTLPQMRIEHAHGSILTFSHAIHRKIKYLRKTNEFSLSMLDNWSELKRATNVLIDNLNNQQPLMASAAIEGLSLVGAAIPLPLPEQSEGGAAEKMDVDGDSGEHSKASVEKCILKILKSAHSRPKLREQAAICLGRLAIGDGKYFAGKNIAAFIGMLKLTKEVELNIAIAKSIVYTVLGREYDVGASNEDQSNPHCDDVALNDFLIKIIRMVADPSPASRMATSIWLIALVRNCSKRQPILKHRELLQLAFTELLSDDSGKRPRRPSAINGTVAISCFRFHSGRCLARPQNGPRAVRPDDQD